MRYKHSQHLFWGHKAGLCVTSPPHPLVVAIKCHQLRKWSAHWLKKNRERERESRRLRQRKQGAGARWRAVVVVQQQHREPRGLMRCLQNVIISISLKMTIINTTHMLSPYTGLSDLLLYVLFYLIRAAGRSVSTLETVQPPRWYPITKDTGICVDRHTLFF